MSAANNSRMCAYKTSLKKVRAAKCGTGDVKENLQFQLWWLYVGNIKPRTFVEQIFTTAMAIWRSKICTWFWRVLSHGQPSVLDQNGVWAWIDHLAANNRFHWNPVVGRNMLLQNIIPPTKTASNRKMLQKVDSPSARLSVDPCCESS